MLLKYVTSACAKNTKRIPAAKSSQSRRRLPLDFLPTRKTQMPAEKATPDCAMSEKKRLVAASTVPVTPKIRTKTRSNWTERTICRNLLGRSNGDLANLGRVYSLCSSPTRSPHGQL